ATVGEISTALEEVWGRYQAEVRSISGVYGGHFHDDADWTAMRQEIDRFLREHGRRPRLLVAKIGQDGHDRGAKVIATAFADLGFDVDVGTLFQTPEEVARQAVENDVHVIGVSTQSGGHKTLVPQMVRELERLGASDIVVTVGGIIPTKDYEFLERAGVKAIFGPGTAIPAAARRVLALIGQSLESGGDPADAVGAERLRGGAAGSGRRGACRRGAGARPARAGKGDHARRERARRPPGGSAALARAPPAARGPRNPRRRERRPGRRQEHLHRVLRA